MRLSTNNVSPAATALMTDIASTSAKGYLDGTTEARCNPGYANLAGKQNPFWGDNGFDANGNPTFGNVYWRANAFEVNMLGNFNDPRAAQLFSLAVNPATPGAAPSVIRGNVFGDVTGTDLTDTYTSGQGPGLLASASQDAILFSGAESLFLQAEASARSLGGFSPANAQGFYEAGITASFVDLGLTSTQAATYYAQNIANVGWAASNGSPAAMENAIITQKWIALTGNFNFEGWNEYLRTGIPALPTSQDPAKVNPTLPNRMLYPLSELNTNATNLGKEGTINPFTSKIFWAK